MKLVEKKDKNYLPDETEIHSLRALMRQFNWLATQTRPDIFFECCNLLGKIKIIDDTKTATKLVNKIKCEQKVMVLKKEDNLANYLCSVMLRLQT